MPIYRSTVTLPYTTNLPGDVSENVFHFVTPDPLTEGTASVIHNELAAFYNNVLGDFSIASRISRLVSRGSERCTVATALVDTSGPKITVGPPIDVFGFTLADAPNNDSLPLEVAVCLSFGSAVSGVPRGRTRGRIFLGPLCFSVNSIGFPSADAPVVAPTFVVDIALAATALANATDAGGVTWGVFSRGGTKPPLGPKIVYEIAGGWVDNAFDTQRRRQVDATHREGWARG